jgi:hypothetical protein
VRDEVQRLLAEYYAALVVCEKASRAEQDAAQKAVIGPGEAREQWRLLKGIESKAIKDLMFIERALIDEARKEP